MYSCFLFLFNDPTVLLLYWSVLHEPRVSSSISPVEGSRGRVRRSVIVFVRFSSRKKKSINLLVVNGLGFSPVILNHVCACMVAGVRMTRQMFETKRDLPIKGKGHHRSVVMTSSISVECCGETQFPNQRISAGFKVYPYIPS